MKETKKLNIFVCDGRSRSSLQLCRSLSAEGHNVHVGEAFFCSTFLSNSVNEKVYYPDPDLLPDSFLAFLEKYLSDKKIDFVFPIRDSSTKILTENTKKLPPNTKFCLPTPTSFNQFQDKGKTVKLAQKLNIPVPKTFFPKPGKSLDYKYLEEALGNPILAKPVKSSGSRGIFVVKNEVEFKVIIESINIENYIFQEFIPHGGALGVYLYSNKGKIIAMNCHQRIREYPYSGGPSTFRISAKNVLSEKISKKLLKSVKWTGPAMVEFRLHSETKIPYLMEVNPRFWGSLAVDLHSGVNFPILILNDTLNIYSNPSHNSREIGVKVRWLFLGDLLWFLMHPNKSKVLVNFLNFNDNHFDMLDKKDPLPVIGALVEGLQSLFKSDRRKHAFRRGWEIGNS